MILLLIIAFFSGLVTILAPCIWPLLPIILSSSTTGGKPKAFGITLGILLSFSAFTLSASYLVSIFHFDPNDLRIFAVIVIGFLGLTLIIPALSARLEGYVSRLSGRFGSTTNAKRNGFSGGLITGLALGLVWTPCAGPILATIATLAATRAVNFDIVLVTLAYAIGVGIPLFSFSLAGSVLFTRSRLLNRYTGRIQQIFGVVMILTALAIFTNYDKVLQSKLLDAFPSYTNFINNLENNKAVQKELNKIKGKDSGTNSKSTLGEFGKASEFQGITKWLNTDKSLTVEGMKGKVILVDFWTYTCINCIRTLPHINSWYDKYKDKGFVVIGVHSPEFEFEKNTDNVKRAIEEYKIHYPVAQDNDFKTWKAYDNQYWPAKYLIDATGKLRFNHFGEGKYDETEEAIKSLLKEAGSQITSRNDNLANETPSGQLSPETYLGSKRMEFLYPNGTTTNGTRVFQLDSEIPKNSFSFGGNWTINSDNSVSGENAVFEYNFQAKKVFLVLRPSSTVNSTVKVFLDGKTISSGSGSDVKNGVLTIDQDRLYNLISLSKGENHKLRLEFQTQGTQIFAFTFG